MASGKLFIVLLASLVLAVACVTVPGGHAEIEVPSPAQQAGTAVVKPPVNEPELAATEPQPVTGQETDEVAEPVPGPEPATELPSAAFDPATVSAEVKEMTFVDVKRLIQNLNTVIQTRNYNLWITNLTEDYLEYWSDPDTLARLSESPVLKRQNITLTSLRDYFTHVVYPSRQNDRVDDIEFIGESRIKAIIINPKGERLVLYNLEKIGDTWKIANWR